MRIVLGKIKSGLIGTPRIVMRGLDPRIHLFRDCRVKPGNDVKKVI
jgi:hypothetical protein